MPQQIQHQANGDEGRHDSQDLVDRVCPLEFAERAIERGGLLGECHFPGEANGNTDDRVERTHPEAQAKNQKNLEREARFTHELVLRKGGVTGCRSAG
ncbi:unannotated protein [freshwater metagenome]|uniref:Unannotated protein n=1 Tax=freshwater metagenome TaxID=449393 RepID=A0A6J6JDK5_9ZZZZ